MKKPVLVNKKEEIVRSFVHDKYNKSNFFKIAVSKGIFVIKESFYMTLCCETFLGYQELSMKVTKFKSNFTSNKCGCLSTEKEYWFVENLDSNYKGFWSDYIKCEGDSYMSLVPNSFAELINLTKDIKPFKKKESKENSYDPLWGEDSLFSL